MIQLLASICRRMSQLLLARDHLVYGNYFINGFLEIFLCIFLVFWMPRLIENVFFTTIQPHSIYTSIGPSGATSFSEALRVNSSLTRLELDISFSWVLLIVIQSHSIYNCIGSSGATSLSEALKVNSSLTQLDLEASLLLNMFNWLYFIHIPFKTILENQEQHHYQKYWRLIHHSLNWSWDWVYYWIWLIDYYWITFHF